MGENSSDAQSHCRPEGAAIRAIKQEKRETPGTGSKLAMTSEEPDLEQEVRRVRDVYSQRTERCVSEWIPQFNLYARYVLYERNEMLVNIFQKLGVETLAGLRVLDVGCASGTFLRYLFDFGAKPEDCFGVDVLEDTLHVAKHMNPNLGFAVASGARLPFPDEAFDIVFQSLVFTSVLNPSVKRGIAGEILRILPRGGRFVWYDFLYNNPRNPNVRGIGRREIRDLLPGCKLQFWRLTLAPPIGRVAGRISPFLYHLLSQVPLFRTHCLCIAEKG
jgi:SAM-dependent methyltransferase